MKKILLIEKSPFVDENVHFLLKLAGFAPVMVRNMDEAINLIEIKRSVQSDFDLLIFSRDELAKYISEYAGIVHGQNSRIKVLLVGNSYGEHPESEPSATFAGSENISFSCGDNLLFDVKKLLGDLETPEEGEWDEPMEWDDLFPGDSG